MTFSLNIDINIARKVIHLIGEEVIRLGVVEVVGFGLAPPPLRLWSDDGSGRTRHARQPTVSSQRQAGGET